MVMTLTEVEHRMSDLIEEVLYRYAEKKGIGEDELMPYLSVKKRGEYERLSKLEKELRAEWEADV